MHSRFCIGLPKINRWFCIGPPKMHRRFRIGPPKMHRRFHIGPYQVSLNLLPPEFYRWGILLPIAIMKEKQQNNLVEIECPIFCKRSNQFGANLMSTAPHLIYQQLSVWPFLNKGNNSRLFPPHHIWSMGLKPTKTSQYMKTKQKKLSANISSLTAELTK